MRKNIMLCGLLFAFVFSFSFGLYTTPQAGDKPEEGLTGPCLNMGHINNCCEVDPITHTMGICVEYPQDTVQCRCDCIFVQYPTCDGPKGCEYDICPTGGGS